jgi:Family of unknown function (DUF6455)
MACRMIAGSTGKWMIMIGYAEAPHAWARAQRMAQTSGLNLAGAVVDGWLARHELGAIVACCQSCAADSACGDWLDHAQPRNAAPAFCANAAVIAGLAPEARGAPAA